MKGVIEWPNRVDVDTTHMNRKGGVRYHDGTRP
jgi:hypothetical protein